MPTDGAERSPRPKTKQNYKYIVDWAMRSSTNSVMLQATHHLCSDISIHMDNFSRMRDKLRKA
jgi:hypothetical protein